MLSILYYCVPLKFTIFAWPVIMNKTIYLVLLFALIGCNLRETTKENGNLTQYTGYLEIDPYTGLKNSRSVTVHAVDGQRTTIDVFYKPSYLKYACKNVVIKGGPAPPMFEGPQQPVDFKVASIKFSPGEKPWDVVPKRVPAPPLVTSQKDIDALKGAWGQATGSVEFFFDPPFTQSVEYSTLTKVEVTMSDGKKVSHEPHSGVNIRELAQYKNAKAATILFETTPDKKKICTSKFCLGK